MGDAALRCSLRSQAVPHADTHCGPSLSLSFKTINIDAWCGCFLWPALLVEPKAEDVQGSFFSPTAPWICLRNQLFCIPCAPPRTAIQAPIPYSQGGDAP